MGLYVVPLRFLDLSAGTIDEFNARRPPGGLPVIPIPMPDRIVVCHEKSVLDRALCRVHCPALNMRTDNGGYSALASEVIETEPFVRDDDEIPSSACKDIGYLIEVNYKIRMMLNTMGAKNAVKDLMYHTKITCRGYVVDLRRVWRGKIEPKRLLD
jgi:hypothetical protein